jgi:hypothetical protein
MDTEQYAEIQASYKQEALRTLLARHNFKDLTEADKNGYSFQFLTVQDTNEQYCVLLKEVDRERVPKLVIASAIPTQEGLI